MLAHYSRVLPSVEINYTFRHQPGEAVLASWRAQAAEGFRLSLKAHQRITHRKRLRDVQEEVEELLRRARLLGDRLGAILFQLPPTLAFDPVVAEGFLTGLPPVAAYAVEPRHPSWVEAAPLLAGHGVALCLADTDARPLGEIPVTAAHAYLRLRRDAYSEEDLAGWAARIRDVLAGGRDVYCYVKHGGGSAAPAYALALREAVG
jgi:uncharacterized protein YecE (DUF72 family)